MGNKSRQPYAKKERECVALFLDAYIKVNKNLTQLQLDYKRYIKELHKNSSLSEQQQSKAKPERRLSEIRSINKEDKNFSTEYLGWVRQFLNEKQSQYGVIDEALEFCPVADGRDKQSLWYYALYYPKGEDIVRCFVETEIQNNAWTSFKFKVFRVEYPKRAQGLLGFRTQYTTRDLEAHPDDIKQTKNLIYLTACIEQTFDEQDLVDNEHFHNYTFRVARKHLSTQKYIFGTFSRVNKDFLSPSSGVCLLKRIFKHDVKEAERECCEPVPPEVHTALYKRRFELFTSEVVPNLSVLPTTMVVDRLKPYVGIWEGRHLDSELNGGIGYLRTFRMTIAAAGTATLEYSDDDDTTRSGTMVKGYIHLLGAERLFVEFAEGHNVEVRAIPRIIICLTKKDNFTLSGSYGGFSAAKNMPYAGAVVIKKMAHGSQIQNISSLQQNLKIHRKLLEGLGVAYDEYVNLPEKSLQEPLLMALDPANEQIESIKGEFRIFSFNSAKDAIVAYPLEFEGGICTMEKEPHEDGQRNVCTAHIKLKGNEIVLQFNDDSGTILIFYWGGKAFSKMKVSHGITLRVNDFNRLQARREILIKDEQSHDFERFDIGGEKLQKLLKEPPFDALKSLLGREFSLMQLPNPQDAKDISTIGKRRDFVDIYFTYAVNQYFNQGEWQSAVKQAILHGGFLLSKDEIQTILNKITQNYDAARCNLQMMISVFIQQCGSIIDSLPGRKSYKRSWINE